jgi:hypothetical protein
MPESPFAPCPDCGQLREYREFLFDHEASDSLRATAIFEMLKYLGIELGAHVRVWDCAPCDRIDAEFVYPGAPRGVVEYTTPPTNRIPPHLR